MTNTVLTRKCGQQITIARSLKKRRLKSAAKAATADVNDEDKWTVAEAKTSFHLFLETVIVKKALR